jgi:hypothetical protein
VKDVHWSDWAQQPDVGICCNEQWCTPAWIQLSEDGVQLPHDVFVGETLLNIEVLYTFNKERVTCPACKARIELGWTREGYPK